MRVGLEIHNDKKHVIRSYDLNRRSCINIHFTNIDCIETPVENVSCKPALEISALPLYEKRIDGLFEAQRYQQNLFLLGD